MSEKSEGGGKGTKSYRRDREERRKGADKKNSEKKSDDKTTPLSSKDETTQSVASVKSDKSQPSALTGDEIKHQNVDKVKDGVSSVKESVVPVETDVINIEAIAKEKERLEKEAIEAAIAEAHARQEWKESLRSKNVEAEANRSDDDKQFFKLDSSLKKNTAFIKKCKTFSEGQKTALMKEMSGLNLTKYIGEVSTALVETKLKMSDIHSMVEFCSALHQRYTEFSSCLLENWTKILSMKKDERVSNPSKMRVDLRLYSELVSVSVFSLKLGLPLLGNVLTTLVAQDKESLANTSILISFCKHCGDDYAGLTPHILSKAESLYGLKPPVPTLLTPQKQAGVRNILSEYLARLVTTLLNTHKELNMVERGNRRQMMTRGEIGQEAKERAARLKEEMEKLKSNTEQMSEAMGEAMVELPKLETEKDEEEEQELAEEVAPDALGALWDDEDTKAFYENLPDLLSIIPSILYKDSKAETEKELKKETSEDLDKEDEEEMTIDDTEPVEEVNLDDDEELGEAVNLSTRMVLDAFLAQLPNCVNRDLIDSAAAEFCMNHNTKSNRKRLVKALFTVHRTRTDLLSFYSRLVAALQPCIADIPIQLGALLKQEFRWQVRKKDQINIESKLKVCRFIGELTKFKQFPKADTLFCLKQLIFDFSHHNIDMACALVETCGQFLFRSPDSHRRMKIYLESMLRKKAAMSLDSRYTTMIENAYYMVAPPDSPQETKKERPPLHQYIRKLLYTDLNKTNTEKILRQIRKLDWEDPDVAAYAIKCIKNVWNQKYFNIRYMASLLAGLVQYQPGIEVDIIDAVLEEIRLGMESLDHKTNQRRTAMVRFLGEMYNYRLVDSSLIFKILYSLITFGVVLDPEFAVTSLDPPDHTVRLRLVCVLLDTCGQYFSSGSSKKKLDYFLLYFQRYFLFKVSCFPSSESFPLGISNLVHETIANLRPKLEMPKDFEASCTLVLGVEEEFLNVLKEKMPTFLADLAPGEKSDGDGLGTIREGDEEEEGHEDLSQASEGNSQSQTSATRSRSASQAAMYEEGIEGDDDKEEGRDEDEREEAGDWVDQDDGGLSQEGSERVLEVEEGDEDIAIPTAPVFNPCPEDDDFLAALDKVTSLTLFLHGI